MISFIRSDRKSTCATNTANNLFKLNSLEEFNWWSNINLSFLFTNGGPWLINVAWRSISSWKNGPQNFKKQLELFAIKYYTRMWLNLLFWIFIRLFKCQPRWEIIFILFTQRLQLDLETVFLIIRLDKFESKKLAWLVGDERVTCRRIFFSLNCLILFTELNRGRKRVRDVCYKRWNLSKFRKEGGSCFCYWLLVLRVSLQLIYAHGFLQLNSNQPYTRHT